MSAKDTGGSAFPTPYTTRDGDHFTTEYQDGMTLRDYFAAKAMSAVMVGDCWDHCKSAKQITATAYQIADAMLAARNTEATS